MKQSAKIITTLLLSLLALAVIGLLLYEILVQKTVDTGNIIKCALIVIGIVLTILRVFAKPRVRISPAAYREAYREQLGNAFSDDKKRELILMTALHKYQSGRYDRTLSLLNKLEPTCVNNAERYAVLFFKTLCFDDMGAIEPAIRGYERLLQFRESSTVSSNLGICYQKLGKYQEAADAYSRAIDLDPENAYPYNNLAQLYLRTEDWEQALEYANDALKRKADFRQALTAKATAHAMMGQDAEYREAARLAAKAGADPSAIEAYVRMLKENGAQADRDEDQA